MIRAENKSSTMLFSMKHQEVILETSIAEFFRSTLRPAIDRVPINDKMSGWDRGLRPDRRPWKSHSPAILEASARADRILAGFPHPAPTIKHGGDAVFYRVHEDTIFVPSRSRFLPGAYFANLLHEAIHASGHFKRLHRRSLVGAFHFHDPRAYAIEEACCEIASIYVLTEIGMPGCLDRSAKYIAYWLRSLTSWDLEKEILHEAQRAVDYVLSGAAVIKTAAAG